MRKNSLQQSHQGRTAGLCGLWQGGTDLDLPTVDGLTFDNFNDWAHSWRVDVKGIDHLYGLYWAYRASSARL